jgi:autotransporter-associated beta strand protein
MVVLAAANTYTGGTEVDAGILRVTQPGAAGPRRARHQRRRSGRHKPARRHRAPRRRPLDRRRARRHGDAGFVRQRRDPRLHQHIPRRRDPRALVERLRRRRMERRRHQQLDRRSERECGAQDGVGLRRGQRRLPRLPRHVHGPKRGQHQRACPLHLRRRFEFGRHRQPHGLHVFSRHLQRGWRRDLGTRRLQLRRQREPHRLHVPRQQLQSDIPGRGRSAGRDGTGAGVVVGSGAGVCGSADASASGIAHRRDPPIRCVKAGPHNRDKHVSRRGRTHGCCACDARPCGVDPAPAVVAWRGRSSAKATNHLLVTRPRNGARAAASRCAGWSRCSHA